MVPTCNGLSWVQRPVDAPSWATLRTKRRTPYPWAHQTLARRCSGIAWQSSLPTLRRTGYWMYEHCTSRWSPVTVGGLWLDHTPLIHPHRASNAGTWSEREWERQRVNKSGWKTGWKVEVGHKKGKDDKRKRKKDDRARQAERCENSRISEKGEQQKYASKMWAYSAFLFKFGKHDNNGSILLPYHAPKVLHSVHHWSFIAKKKPSLYHNATS